MAKRSTTKPAALPQQGSIDQQRTGLYFPEYNAAVDLQVAIRDAIKRPVTMLQALAYARTVIRTGANFKKLAEIFDEETTAADRARQEERDRISREAGAKKGR